MAAEMTIPASERPVTVRIEDFQKGLNEAVLNSELPPYLIEVFMAQYLEGVSRVARKEYAQSREEWKKNCAADKARKAAEAANKANRTKGSEQQDG